MVFQWFVVSSFDRLQFFAVSSLCTCSWFGSRVFDSFVDVQLSCTVRVVQVVVVVFVNKWFVQ